MKTKKYICLLDRDRNLVLKGLFPAKLLPIVHMPCMVLGRVMKPDREFYLMLHGTEVAFYMETVQSFARYKATRAMQLNAKIVDERSFPTPKRFKKKNKITKKARVYPITQWKKLIANDYRTAKKAVS